MHTLTVILRLVHVFSGVFWAGSTLLFYFVIGPTIMATGDAGRKFAQYLILKARFTTVIAATAGLTILAGFSLYWIDSGGLTSAWTRSGAGVGFGLGALAGIVTFIFGIIFGRNNTALVNISSSLQGMPTPEQMASIQAIQKSQKTVGLVMAVSMIIAVACMATARYWLI